MLKTFVELESLVFCSNHFKEFLLSGKGGVPGAQLNKNRDLNFAGIFRADDDIPVHLMGQPWGNHVVHERVFHVGLDHLRIPGDKLRRKRRFYMNRRQQAGKDSGCGKQDLRNVRSRPRAGAR